MDAHSHSEAEEEHNNNVIWEKIGAACLIVILSTVCGFLPIVLSKKYDFTMDDTTDEIIIKKRRKSTKNVVLSFLLNLGGGVLLANCFCHWLPEVREGLEPTVSSIKAEVPLAELTMCCGFFFICLLEEILHYFIRPHKPTALQQINQVGTSATTDSESELTETHTDKEKEAYEITGLDYEEKEERTKDQIKSAIRTIFIISALSFHSTIEGLALSLEEESAGVWMNTGATALHKFVISFSVGVELISNKVSPMKYNISIIVFSLAPALGVVIGIMLTELTYSATINDLPIQLLQGIATGTVIYVVFFEIFPKAKSLGGTGFQHVISMMIGFALFLPSLYFHGISHHGDEEDHEH